MPSTFSSLKFELIATGEQDGIWGDTTNVNIGTAIEQAITGSGNVVFTSSDVTLTLTNDNNAQTARNLRLVCVGTSGGARQLIVPSIEKQYIVQNDLADTVTIRTAAGTGIAVPPGKTMVVFNNGTDVVDVTTYASELTVAGNLTGSNASFSGAISSVSPAFTGTPTAPTAANGTSTTQIATTEFVGNAISGQGLGTMASQDANAVAITGGTISGVSGSNPGMSVGTATNAASATFATTAGNAGFPNYASPSAVPIGSAFQAASNGFVTIAAQGTYRNGMTVYAGSTSATPYLIAIMGHDINNNTWGWSYSFPMKSGSWALIVNDSSFSPGQGFESVTAYFWPVS